MFSRKRVAAFATCSALVVSVPLYAQFGGLDAFKRVIGAATGQTPSTPATPTNSPSPSPTPTSVIASPLASPTLAPVPASKSAKTMIAEWDELNDRCRGGSGDDARTWSACDARDALGEKIDSAGWCQGKIGEWVGDAKWHRCTEDSCARQPGGSC